MDFLVELFNNQTTFDDLEAMGFTLYRETRDLASLANRDGAGFSVVFADEFWLPFEGIDIIAFISVRHLSVQHFDGLNLEELSLLSDADILGVLSVKYGVRNPHFVQRRDGRISTFSFNYRGYYVMFNRFDENWWIYISREVLD